LHEVARDRIAVCVELGQELRPVGGAHAAGDARAVFVILRQRLGLLIVQVLQSMLELAQVFVGVCELVHRRRRQQAASAKKL
jgi:hypothetical protein